MFGYITQQAVSVGAARRHELAIQAKRDTPLSRGGARQAMGLALVAVGQRLAGKIPGGQAAQSSSECA